MDTSDTWVEKRWTSFQHCEVFFGQVGKGNRVTPMGSVQEEAPRALLGKARW